MNWDALGAAAELIGALAVFVTLIYLSLQIRNQNQVTAAQIHQQRADSVIQLTSVIHETEGALELMARLLRPTFQVTELDEMELLRARLLITPIRANFENTFDQYRHGFLSEEFYQNVAIENCRTYGALILKLDLPITDSFRVELERILAK